MSEDCLGLARKTIGKEPAQGAVEVLRVISRRSVPIPLCEAIAHNCGEQLVGDGTLLPLGPLEQHVYGGNLEEIPLDISAPDISTFATVELEFGLST